MTAFDFEPSGKMKLPSLQELLNADQDTAILAYSYGMLDGAPYWAYVAVKPSKYHEFYRRANAKESFLLSDYGTVLASGMSGSPPPEVVREMHEKYGADPTYENKLIADANKQQDGFVATREQKRIRDIVTMLKKKQAD